MTKRTLALLALAISSSAAAANDSLLSCKDLHVTYSNPLAMPLKDRVIVTRLSTRPKAVLKETDSEYKSHSPQNTAAFNRVHIADTTKPGLWDNAFQVFSTSGPIHAWQIDLKDISDNASIEWLNEDLVLVRVWWGRIVSTDLIFQLSTGGFVYAQEANYGMLTQPCQ